MWPFNYLSKDDPVKHCVVYKRFGCFHVDGMICDFKTCDTRLNQEMFDLEQELDIPFKDRFYNQKNKYGYLY
jgi:hypothetical protein